MFLSTMEASSKILERTMLNKSHSMVRPSSKFKLSLKPTVCVRSLAYLQTLTMVLKDKMERPAILKLMFARGASVRVM